MAERALLDEGHDSKVYELSGPEAITLPSTAEVLSAAIGRPVTHVETTIADDLAESAADRDRAIKTSGVDMFGGPYFVNGGLLVAVVEAAPSPQSSPLAERIRRECGCGEVRHPRGAP